MSTVFARGGPAYFEVEKAHLERDRALSLVAQLQDELAHARAANTTLTVRVSVLEVERASIDSLRAQLALQSELLASHSRADDDARTAAQYRAETERALRDARHRQAELETVSRALSDERAASALMRRELAAQAAELEALRAEVLAAESSRPSFSAGVSERARADPVLELALVRLTRENAELRAALAAVDLTKVPGDESESEPTPGGFAVRSAASSSSVAGLGPRVATLGEGDDGALALPPRWLVTAVRARWPDSQIVAYDPLTVRVEVRLASSLALVSVHADETGELHVLSTHDEVARYAHHAGAADGRAVRRTGLDNSAGKLALGEAAKPLAVGDSEPRGAHFVVVHPMHSSSARMPIPMSMPMSMPMPIGPDPELKAAAGMVAAAAAAADATAREAPSTDLSVVLPAAAAAEARGVARARASLAQQMAEMADAIGRLSGRRHGDESEASNAEVGVAALG